MESKVKYFLYLITFIIASHILTAQSFVELKQFTPFDSIKTHTIIFFDFNNDNRDDLFIMGVDKHNNAITKLYKNDNGTLKEDEEGLNFKAFRSGSAAASDFDRDGDNDLFVIGNDNHPNGEDLLVNDNGKFTRFKGRQDFYRGNRVAFSDINNDNRDEIFISEEYLGTIVVFKYEKKFQEEQSYHSVKNLSFDVGGEFGLVDVDNDGFEDLIVAGMNQKREILTKLYKNTAGVFEEVLNTPFENLKNGFLKFADIDNNGFKDILISGVNVDGEIKINLYKNTAGIFEEVIDTPFAKLSDVNSAFSDWDNNGYVDLLITGLDETESYQTIFYKNENGIFVKDENVSENFKSIGGGAIAFSDIDSDGYEDLLISGQNENGGLETTLYKNERGEFVGLYGTPFFGVEDGSIAFSDIDNDGYEDLLITGYNNHASRNTSKIYKNVGGLFEEIVNTPFDAVRQSSSVFFDINNDGYEDLLISSATESAEKMTKLYKNNTGTFKEVLDAPFGDILTRVVAFSDVDKNGYEDLFISGFSKTGMIAKLYKNENGKFSNTIEAQIDAIVGGDAAFSDVDNDGYVDLFILGFNKSNERIAKLYRNEEGTFKEVPNTPFDTLSEGTTTFIDIDNDGFEELLITGLSSIRSQGLTTKLYKNTSGTFTELLNTPFDGVYSSSVVASDIDNNGYKDLLISGSSKYGKISKLYLNESGTFTELLGTPFEGVSLCSVAITDINNDGYKDLYITGRTNSKDVTAKLYKNLGPISSVKFDEKEFGYDFELYPNPTKSDKFKINFKSEFIGQLDIEVLDINGKVMLKINETIQLGQESVSVSTGFLTNGFYLVKITSSGKEEIHKLIMQ